MIKKTFGKPIKNGTMSGHEKCSIGGTDVLLRTEEDPKSVRKMGMKWSTNFPFFRNDSKSIQKCDTHIN